MRQFISDSMPDKDGCLHIEGNNFHYLSSVLRVACGDMIYVRLPGGALQQMTVACVDTSSAKVILTVAGESAAPAEDSIKAAPIKEKPAARLWLFMFVAKPPKMELVVRQAAECGVEYIVPVIGKFCQKGNIESAKKKSSADDERWRRIITEARGQSGSPVETQIMNCMSIQEACSLWKNRTESQTSVGVVLYEQTRGTKSLHEAVALKKAGESFFTDAAVMVGAEGGIAPEEVQLAFESGFVPVHFNTNILRCETAALYGIAALQSAITESVLWQLKE